jgi:photosystem II stability/assembly factor-like uncharacterized protein
MKRFTKIFLSFLLFSITLLGFAIPLNIQSSNWYNQYLPNLNNRPLSDITFVDSLLGFGVTGDNTVGDTNYIIKTTNGGDNWFKLDSVYGDISRVIFINANTGYICGGWRTGMPGGFVSKTTNSGINWSVLPSSVFANHFNDMFILYQDTIWVVDDNGFDGGVFRSTNAGLNWEMIFNGSISNPHPQKIYMYDKNIGFFSTGDVFGFLYRTTNGGFNWTKINDELGFSQIYFIDSLIGWKAAYNQMKKSTDGGLNWINQSLPLGNIGGITHFHIFNIDTILGVGSSYQYPNLQNRGVIYRTTNSGLNWCYQILDTGIVTIPRFNFIKFINRNIGWIYSLSRGIHTTNGGDTTFISNIKERITNNIFDFVLYQNYPNPFNSISNIKYKIENNSNVKLIVFDIIGKEISILVNKKQNKGEYIVKFNGINLSSGIYFYSLFVDDIRIDSKKLVLMK